MMRLLTAIFLPLLSFISHTVAAGEGTVPAQLPPPDASGLVGFLALMVVLIGGFVWFIVRKERERKQRDAENK